MKPLDLTSVRQALIVAPHPDDETIGAFGLACLLKRRGADVRIIVVTDGAASHSSRRWPPRRLAAKRKLETRHAMRRANVPAGAITFLGLRDSGLAGLSADEQMRLCRRLSLGPEPDLVIRPAASDHHADHQRVALACEKAWPPRVRQLTYLVWPDEGRAEFSPRLRLRLSNSTRRRKLAALKSYRTQTGLIKDDPDGFCMDRPLMARLTRPDEVFGEA